MDDIDPLRTRLAKDAGWLRRLAGALVADADDLLQDAALARLTGQAARAAHPGALLRNLGRKAARRERRLAAREKRAAMERSGLEAEATDRIVERSETASVLLDEVRALGGGHRAVLVLHYFEGADVRDIARSSGATDAAVRQRLVRARAALRARLEARFGSEGPGGWRGALALFSMPRGEHAIPLASSGAALPGVLVMKLILTGCACLLAAVYAWHLSNPLDVDGGATRRQDGNPARVGALPTPGELAVGVEVEPSGAKRSMPVSPSLGTRYPLIEERVATVAGRVLQRNAAGTLEPVQGAELRPLLRPFGEPWPARMADLPLTALTDESGRFRVGFNVFEDGSFQLLKPGLASLYLELESENPSESKSLDDDLHQDLGDIVMTPGHTVVGTVFDASMTPLEGAEIRLMRMPGGFHIWNWDEVFLEHRPADGVTGSDGRFALDSCEDPTVRLRVSCHGYHDRAVESPDGDPITVVLEASSRVRGRLTGPLAGSPEPKGVIAWVDDELFAVTETGGFHGRVQPDGNFEIDGLVEGRAYLLQAISDVVPSMSSEPLSHRMAVQGGDEGVEVETVIGASLNAHFVGPGGQPVKGLDVMAGFDHATMHHQPLFRSPLLTDPFTAGVLRLERIVPHQPGQTLHVEVDADGYEPWVADVGPFTPGGTLDLGTVTLLPEVRRVRFQASATLLVVDDRGTPIPGAPVERFHYPESDGEVTHGFIRGRSSLAANASGIVDMHDLSAGEYHFRQVLEPGVHAPDAGSVARHGLDPSLSGAVALRVTDPPTHPSRTTLRVPAAGPLQLELAGPAYVGGELSLVAGHDSGFLERARTESLDSRRLRLIQLGKGGFASFDRLPYGPWTAVHKDAEGHWSWATFEHRSGRDAIRLELRNPRLTGRIVGPDGSPLANALIRFEHGTYTLERAEYWLTRDIAFGRRRGRAGILDMGADGQMSTKTGADGLFTLPVPMVGTPSRWRLFVSHDDHASREITWGADSTEAPQDLGEIALVRSGTVLLTRVAVDGVARWSLKAVEVSGDPLWGCDLWKEVSPPRFERVPPGRLRLEGRDADGEVVRSAPVRVQAGETCRISVD